MIYAVVGAGYTGSRVVGRLTDRGASVVGTTRTGELDESGPGTFPVEPFDLEDPGSMERFWEGLSEESLRVIFTPGPSIRLGLEKGVILMERFLDRAPVGRLERFVYLSSTSVYGDAGGEWVTETTPMSPFSESGELRRRVETLLQDGLPERALVRCRIGGIYGPGRNAAERYLSEEYELVGEGDNWTNRIRVEDLVRVIVLLAAGNQTGIYNLVDRRPSPLGDLVEFLYRATGRDPSTITRVSWEEAEERYSDRRLGLLKPQKRVGSTKLQEDLAFSYRFPTPFHGLIDLLNKA